MRPKALSNLLGSIRNQSLYPNQILIVDGSSDNKTQNMISALSIRNLKYFKVSNVERGLTKQRNYGIERINPEIEIVCFLDDDIILESNYFEELLSTYEIFPNALGVGGYITNEVEWKKSDGLNNKRMFYLDGWMRKEPLRFRVRSVFNLLPDKPPCFLPSFSHGRSVGFLPPSSKIYSAELFMGGVSSFKSKVFKKLKFSEYFEGYGLYEDADFCLRLSKLGPLYVNTSARLAHYHEVSGRPNKFKYGKMVIRNGWYIWKVKYPNPKLKYKFKWYLTAVLLNFLVFSRLFYSKSTVNDFSEALGRGIGLFSLLFYPPKAKQ